MVKGYWLIVNPENRFGPKNFGVTAFSSEHAKSLAKGAIIEMGWTHISEATINEAEIIEMIDVTTLDENHVLPNIGVVSRQGIWFPNCDAS